MSLNSQMVDKGAYNVDTCSRDETDDMNDQYIDDTGVLNILLEYKRKKVLYIYIGHKFIVFCLVFNLY